MSLLRVRASFALAAVLAIVVAQGAEQDTAMCGGFVKPSLLFPAPSSYVIIGGVWESWQQPSVGHLKHTHTPQGALHVATSCVRVFALGTAPWITPL